MTKKEKKVNDINEALQKSSIYNKVKPKAEIIEGRIVYSMLSTSSLGKPYRIKVDFMTILGQMHGDQMREIYAKYGRKKK